ncbi:hypothetical protein, partial [Pasteurella multocida]|uniref:hypothetical protein n=1 Tax=Pasteurella multocida TaxID=747 RepID=UPI00027B2568
FLYRDEENIVKIYGEEKYKTLGNNIYAFCISKIDEYLDRVSIEYYYPEEDRIKFDVNNRRLFSGTDFHKGTPNSKCGKYQTKKQDKAGKLTIIDEAVYEKLDLEMSKSIALSKNEFAENILNQKNGFETMNFENFRLILNVISDIVIS